MKQAGLVLAGLLMLVAGCSSHHSTGSSSSSSGSDSGSSSSSGCGEYQEGDYHCRGGVGSDTIDQCVGGKWVFAHTCSCTVSVGDPRKPPYVSNCKHDGLGYAECSYAGVACLQCEMNSTCQ